MAEGLVVPPTLDRESSSADQERAIRLGDIAFLNCAPIRWGLRNGDTETPLAVEPALPERLAELLLGGKLDISPVSLVRYLRHADELLLLPGLAIASDGPVRSCLIVSDGPLERLDDRTVALSRDSRSSTLLARILLEDTIGVRPRYRRERQHLDTMLSVADAAVLIGDEALHANVTRQRGLVAHDVGQLWRDWTGLPMVFAVWAARRDFAGRHPGRVRAAHATLLAARRRALRNLAAVTDSAAREPAARESGAFTREVLLDYYQCLDYTLGERHLASIRAFARLGAARGELPADIQVSLAPVSREGLP